jgi:hypothetical protein
VVFGSALGFEDAHISDALSENAKRTIAVSMLPGESTANLLARQMEIYGRVEVDELVFFDATTHPLGVPGLKVGGP